MLSQTEEKFPVWYRTYVLLILLLVCISNLATRNQPSFLITIPAPECEEVCRGVLINHPTCELQTTPPITPSREQLCTSCRSKPALWQGAVQRTPPRELLPPHDNQAIILQTGVETHSARLSFLEAGSAHVSLRLEEPAPSPRAAQVDTVSGFYNLADGTCLWYWQYGLLIGYGFALVYAAGSIPAGWLCDRHRRTGIIALSLFVWSMATCIQAQGTGLWLLLTCRTVVGLAQSFGTPACVSLMVDYFASNSRQRDMALGLLTMVGPQLGVGCASFSIVFAELLGWRWVMLLTGILGALLALVVLATIKEPQRTEWSAPCPTSVVVDEVFEKSRVAQYLLCAVSAKMLSSYTLMAFLPIWYSRRNLHGYTNDAYAFWNALAVSLAGLFSVCIGSIIGQAFGTRTPCFVGLLGAVASVPLIFFMLLTSYFRISLICYFLVLMLGEAWLGPSMTLLQQAVRRSVRGQATSMLLVISALAGNLGPALVGILDPGGVNIQIHLLWICTAAQVLAALSFYWTAREISLDPVSVGLGLAQDKAP